MIEITLSPDEIVRSRLTFLSKQCILPGNLVDNNETNILQIVGVHHKDDTLQARVF